MIIATGSETGILGSRKLPDYSATKGAVEHSPSLSHRSIEQGIRVNASRRDRCGRPQSLRWRPHARRGRAVRRRLPDGAAGAPEELAPAYVYLASDADSSYMTGTVLQVMGGETTGG